MSEHDDPPRWSDGDAAPPVLSALLANAKRDTATDTELAQLSARLGPVLTAPPPGSSMSPALIKLVAAGLIAALGGGVALYVGNRPATSPTPARPATPTPKASATQTLAPPASSEPLTVPPLPASATPDAPAAPPSSPSVSVQKKPAAASSQAADSTAAEAALLEQARSNLASNPAQALSLASQHAARFPRGLLAQEREVIAISALRRLGRSAEAEARAARFDARYPKSAHQQAVDSPATR